MNTSEYTGFISYTHKKNDKKWAKWLRKSLESYRVPRSLVSKGYPKKLGKFYRDEDEYSASPNLPDSVKAALSSSYSLIAICSEDTQASAWVEEEIDHFQNSNQSENIFALLISGEPKQAFPKALLGKSDGPLDAIPAAADVRPTKGMSKRKLKKIALMRLVSGILGCSFDDLMMRERSRTKRKIVLAVTCISLLLIAIFQLWNFGSTSQQTLNESQSKAFSNIATQSLAAGKFDSAQRIAILAATPSAWHSASSEAEATLSLITNSNKLLRDFTLPEKYALGHPDFEKNGGFANTTIRDVAVNQSETRLASYYQNGSIRIWDIETGKILLDKIKAAKSSEDALSLGSGLTFLNSGSELASWNSEGVVEFWDTLTGEPSRSSLDTRVPNITSLKFSEDGSLLLMGDSEKPLSVWVFNSGELVSPYSLPREQEKDIKYRDAVLAAISLRNKEAIYFPLNNSVAHWSSSDRLEIFDTKTRQIRHSIHVEGFSLDGWKLSKDGNKIVFWGDQETDDVVGIIGAVFIDANKHLIRTLPYETTVEDVYLSNSGNLAIIDTYNFLNETDDDLSNPYQVWDINKLRPLGGKIEEKNFTLNSVLWSSDENFAVLNGTIDTQDKSTATLKMINSRTSDSIGPLMMHEGSESLDGLKFSENEKVIHSWRYDSVDGFKGTRWTWDVESKRLAEAPAVYSRTGLTDLIYSGKNDHNIALGENYLEIGNDGTNIVLDVSGIQNALYLDKSDKVVGWSGSKIRLWEALSIQKTTLPHQPINVQVDTKQQILASMNKNGEVIIKSLNYPYDYSTVLEGTNSDVPCTIYLEPTVSRLVYTCSNGTLKVWDTLSRESIFNSASNIEVTGFSVSFNKKMMSFYRKDGSIVVNDLTTGMVLGEPMQHTKSEKLIFGTLFFQDDTKLLSWGADGKMVVWDIANQNSINSTFSHDKTISKVQIFEEFRRIISCDDTGKVNIWDLDTGLIVPDAVIEAQGPYCGMKIKNHAMFTDLAGVEFWNMDNLVRTNSIFSSHINKYVAHLSEPNNLLVRSGSASTIYEFGDGDTLSVYDLSRLNAEVSYFDLPKVGKELKLEGANFNVLESPSGNNVAILFFNGQIRVLDSHLNDIMLPFYHRNLQWASFDETNNQLITWGHTGSVKIWKLPVIRKDANLIKFGCEKRMPGTLSKLTSNDADQLKDYKSNIIGFDVCEQKRSWRRIFK